MEGKKAEIKGQLVTIDGIVYIHIDNNLYIERPNMADAMNNIGLITDKAQELESSGTAELLQGIFPIVQEQLQEKVYFITISKLKKEVKEFRKAELQEFLYINFINRYQAVLTGPLG